MKRTKKAAKPQPGPDPLCEAGVVLDQMKIECFKMWSGTALRSFLCVRNKSQHGDLEELAAR